MVITCKDEDFKEDLLILLNSDEKDTECKPEILDKIKSYEFGTLLQTTKEIGSAVKIINVEELTEENIF